MYADEKSLPAQIDDGLVAAIEAPQLQSTLDGIIENDDLKAIKKLLITRLESISKNNKPAMQNVPRYNLIADQLAQFTTPNGLPSMADITLLTQVAFPKLELRILVDHKVQGLSADLTQLTPSNVAQLVDDFAVYWSHRSAKNGLHDPKFSQFGVGLSLNNAKTLTATIYLVDPILSYNKPFPLKGDVHLVAQVIRPGLDRLKTKQRSFKRGFLDAVEIVVNTNTLKIQNGEVKIDLVAPKEGWANVQYQIAGQTTGPGRILRSATDTIQPITQDPLFSKAALTEAASSTNIQPVLKNAETTLLQYINQSRQRHQQSTLKWDASAAKVAQTHCQEIVDRGYIGHWGQDGSKPYHRYHRAGGSGSVSENLAWICSYKTNTNNCDGRLDQSELGQIKLAQNGHDAFMAEQAPNDGHRQTVLAPNHTSVGIGLAVRDGAFAYCEEYVAQYATLDPVLGSPQVNQPLTLSGKMLDPAKFGIYYLSVSYDPPLEAYLVRPQPGSYPNFGDQRVSGSFANTINYSATDGVFTHTFIPTKPGLYYVQYCAVTTGILSQLSSNGNVTWNTKNCFPVAAQVIDVASAAL